MLHEDRVASSAWSSELLPMLFLGTHLSPWVTFVGIKLNAHCQIHYTEYYKGSRVNESNTFYCFIKDILKWNWLFPLWMRGNKNPMTSSIARWACPDLWQQFCPCCFCTVSLSLGAAGTSSQGFPCRCVGKAKASCSWRFLQGPFGAVTRR